MKTRKIVLLHFLVFISCYSFNENEEERKYDHGLSPWVHDLMFNVSFRESIRIKPFYLDMDWASEHVKAKIMDQLIPAAISYFETVLKVNRLSFDFEISDQDLLNYCEIQKRPPEFLKEGAPADIIIFVMGGYDMSDALADSFSCIYHQVTNRPLAGVMRYNVHETWSGMDEMIYEKHLTTTLHEIAHLLGFSRNHFEYYVDPVTGRVLDGVLSKKMVNGIETSVLSLEPLNSRIRGYFNCPILEGAYLENEGGTGSQNSHFERRIFFNELMTSYHTEDLRITEFTLSVFEGSGWFTPNYSMAEPIFWGKGKGCAFLDEKCITPSQTARFNDSFCDQRGEKGCSFSGLSKSECGSSSVDYNTSLNPEFDYFNDQRLVDDPSADNCPYYIHTNKNACYNPENVNTRIIEGETYGPGSMCFSGTLYKQEADIGNSTNLYCIKQSCKEIMPGDFNLHLEIEGASYSCLDGGFIEVKGYSGHLDCPRSINEYCSTKAVKFCKRGCMGRGRCVEGECICDEGFDGPGCSINTALYPQAEPGTEKRSNIPFLLLALIVAFIIIYFGKAMKSQPQTGQAMYSSAMSPNMKNTSSMTIPIVNNYEEETNESKPFVELTSVGTTPQSNILTKENNSEPNRA